MSIIDFYLNVFGEALIASVLATLVLGGLCWLVELVVRHGIGFYAGFIAIFAVVCVILRFAYFDVSESLAGVGDMHGWRMATRILYLALASITVPLLIFSEIKLRRWSLRRAPLTH